MKLLPTLIAPATFCLAIMQSPANAGHMQLTCVVVDNIDPSPGRFQFRVTNPANIRDLSVPGHMSLKPNTVTIPAGAQVTVSAFRAFTSVNIPIRVSFTFQLDAPVAPKSDTSFPRPGEIEITECTAAAKW